MTKYKAFKYLGSISEIKISDESEGHVILENGKYELKEMDNYKYFDYWENARVYLIDHSLKRVKCSRRCLELAESDLEKIRKLENSEIPNN